MPKLGFLRSILFLLLAVVSVQVVRAQSDEPHFVAPQWRIIAQYFDEAENHLYKGTTPGNLPNYATAQAACQAGAAYVLPRLRFSDYSVAYQPTMQFGEIRPYGKIDYIAPSTGLPYYSIKGRKCAINGWETTYGDASVHDIYENGTRITTLTRRDILNDDGEVINSFWMRNKAWVGSISVAPICPPLYSLITREGEPTCAALERPINRTAPDCEGVDGDSPKSAPPKKCAGNPIAIDSGTKQHQDMDYATADGLFGVQRKYRSNARPENLSSTITEIPGFGLNWRGLIPGRITVQNPSGSWSAEFLNDDGGVRRFYFVQDGQGGFTLLPNLTTPTRLKLDLTQPLTSSVEDFVAAPAVPNGAADFRLTYANGDYMLFRASGTLDAQSNSRHYVPIEHGLANGYKRWFDYSDSGQYPYRVRDSLGRQMAVGWQDIGYASTQMRGYFAAPNQPTPPELMSIEKAVSSITLPDGTTMAYTYAASGTSGFLGRLATAKHLDAANAILWGRTYLYENSSFPTALTGMLDQNGERLSTYSYDEEGRAQSTERAEGYFREEVEYSRIESSPENFDQPLDVREVTNARGLKTKYTYSGFTEDYSPGESPGPNPRFAPRRLLRMESEATSDLAARTQSLEYDDDGLIEAQVDANGNRTEQENISGEARPETITDANGTPTDITWHPTLDLPSRTVRKRLQTDYDYDAGGQLTEVKQTDLDSGEVRKVEFEMGAAGRIEEINGPRQPDAQGRDDITTMVYDAQGNRETMTNGLGHVTRYEDYDANGRPERVINPNGVITELDYDDLGRTKTITIKDSSDPSKDAVTAIDYDVEGRVKAISRPATARINFDYNLAGLMTAIYSDDGERIEYAYDLMGNVLSQTVKRVDGSQARGIVRTFDELGRTRSETLGPGRTHGYQYDKVGNLEKLTTPRGNEFENSFDALNRLVATITPDSEYDYYFDGDTETIGTQPVAVSSPGSSAANELGVFEDGNAAKTHFTRNAFGQVTQEVSADRGTITYEYDLAGDLKAMTDGRGQRIEYTRDILGRVLSATPVGRPTSEIVYYEYDLAAVGTYQKGLLSRITDSSGVTTLQYDHRGNLIVKRQPVGSGTPKLSYTYDLADRVIEIRYPSGRLVHYDRDSKGRVIAARTKANANVASWTDLATSIQYEAFGAPTSVAMGNTLTLKQNWGNDGRLVSRRLRTVSGSHYSRLTYSYDNDDNITAIADLVTPANDVAYTYDPVGRLQQVTLASGAVRRTDFAFDGNGNRIEKSSRPLPTDPDSAASVESYATDFRSNQLDSISGASGTRTFSYDGRGNLASEMRPGGIAITASYDGHGRLTSYARTGEPTLTHAYNGLDDRVSTTSGTDTRRFVYDLDGRTIGEYGASVSDVKAEFIWMNPQVGDAGPFGGDDGLGGYMPLAVAVGTGIPSETSLVWVHANHMGVPIVYSDASGAQFAGPPGDYAIPGFPGQSRTLADLYYNRYRDYDPTTGRYIQADPIGLSGGANPYSYAMNNPLRYSDPTGEIIPAIIAFCVTPWGAVACTAVVGAATSAISEVGVQGVSNLWHGRDVFDPDCYDWNEVGIAAGMGAFGGGAGRIVGGGLRYGAKSLTRETGLEWSHSIPRKWVNNNTDGALKKLLNQRGGLNGRWVTAEQHYLHDPFRYPVGYGEWRNRLRPWQQNLDRFPEWMRGAGAGGLFGIGVGEADGT